MIIFLRFWRGNVRHFQIFAREQKIEHGKFFDDFPYKREFTREIEKNQKFHNENNTHYIVQKISKNI